MSQYFLMSAAARSLSIGKVMRMSDHSLNCQAASF